MNPLVSVVMTSYNRSKLINRAILSVINQSYQNWELIIVDDASTDNTPTILKEWTNKEKGIKVVINKKNLWRQYGLSPNLNKGIDLSKGKYIARLDDDDYWIDKDKIKKQVEFLENNPDYVVCGGGAIVEDESEKEVFRYLKNEKDEEIRKRILFANPFTNTTTVFLKTVFEKVGGYGDCRYAEDWDLWLKLGALGRFYNFQEYFTRYLIAGYSFIYQKSLSKMILKIITKYKKNYPSFRVAYFFNLLQYLYSLLPLFLKRSFHPILARLKRSI